MNAVPNAMRRLVAPNVVSTVGDREIRVTVATENVARDGCILVVGGIDLESYRRNPVVLWQHDPAQPIARCSSIAVVGRTLQATVAFPPEGTSEQADEAFQLIRAGVVNALSIGWIPLAQEPITDARGRQTGWKFTRSDMLEFSIVSVPSDPGALIMERSYGGKIRGRASIQTKSRATGANLQEAASDLRAIAHLAAAEAKRRATVARFPSLAENLRAIARAAQGEPADQRLERAPTGASEVDPTGGGFLVEPQYAEGLIASLYEESPIAGLCDRRTTAKPLAETRLPAVDETSRADGSRYGGVTVFWAAEADNVSPSLPRIRNVVFASKKLIGVVYGTNELLQDAPMFDAWVRRAFASEMGFKLDLAILAGTGAGVPLGILHSPALITVAGAAEQSSGTVVSQNVMDMWKRLAAPCRRRAVWLVNEDVEEQLDAVSNGLPPGMWLPAGFNGNAFPLLKGRPVVTVEQCSPLGTLGDIMLCDLSQYVVVDGGFQTTLSAHVEFLNDQVVWRFVLRVDGSPAWTSPIQPFNGSGLPRSPFVALGPR